MFFGNEYEDSQNYINLPGFDKLTAEQQKRVHEEYTRGYNSSQHLGIKIAMGKGFQTAKCAFEECQKRTSVGEQTVPPSIFAGLENCQ
jgi:hypothetical protein